MTTDTSDPHVARCDRAIDALRSVERQLNEVRATEPVYGLLVVRSTLSEQPVPAWPLLPSGLGHRNVQWGAHKIPPTDVSLSHRYFREETSIDRHRKARVIPPEDAVLTDDVLNAIAHACEEPTMELVGRLGGLHRTYTSPWDEGLPQPSASAWAGAVYDRCVPDALWVFVDGQWVRSPVTSDPPIPHAVAFYDLAAASVQTIDFIVKDATARMGRSHHVDLELLDLREKGKQVVILRGSRLRLSDAHFDVLYRLAVHHRAKPGEPAPLPAGPEAAKRFQTRLSDFRSPKARISSALRRALADLPAPLVHPKEPRFNPALAVDVTFP